MAAWVVRAAGRSLVGALAVERVNPFGAATNAPAAAAVAPLCLRNDRLDNSDISTLLYLGNFDVVGAAKPPAPRDQWAVTHAFYGAVVVGG